MAVMQQLQPAESFKSDGEGFAQDLVFKNIRAVVLALIESPDCTAELRELCIRFLLQSGTVRADAEDILRAALLQR